MNELPSRLSCSPLLEVVFEIRFDSDFPFSVMAPGLLFGDRLSYIKAESQPAQQIPKNIRDKDPNFRYLPLIRFLDGDKSFSISDHSLVISLKKNYTGWKDFRSLIIESINKLNVPNLLKDVSSLSLLYINGIEHSVENNLANIISGKLELGPLDLTQSSIQLAAELQEEKKIIPSVKIVNPALINDNGSPLPDSPSVSLEPKLACVIEIRTVRKSDLLDFTYNYKKDSENYLDELHSRGKGLFFSILNKEIVNKLGANYVR